MMGKSVISITKRKGTHGVKSAFIVQSSCNRVTARSVVYIWINWPHDNWRFHCQYKSIYMYMDVFPELFGMLDYCPDKPESLNVDDNTSVNMAFSRASGILSGIQNCHCHNCL